MTSSQAQLTRDLTDLMLGAPFVAASRIARLAMPGELTSARGRTEITRMITEKQIAAAESFLSILTAYQLQIMDFWLRASFMQPPKFPTDRELIASTRAAIKPYRKRVAGNVRRINRSKS